MRDKFTPGPWVGAPEGAPGPMWWNVLAGSDAVASYCRLEDARLIAAAPDLFELLTEAMDSRAPDLADAEHPGWADRARAALAKARGETA